MSAPKTYDRQAKRTYTGILPAMYDKIDVGYPTTVKEVFTFSLYDERVDTYVVSAIIEVIYTDSTKKDLLSVTKTYNAPGG